MLNNSICNSDNCFITTSSGYYLDLERGNGSGQGQVAASSEQCNDSASFTTYTDFLTQMNNCQLLDKLCCLESGG